VRRLTVALSRARLGLYVLGRRSVFENCLELKPAFDILLQRPDKLILSTGELYPSKRILSEENETVRGEAQMEGVEHLGQYVFEMTNAKVQQLRAEQGLVGEAPLQITSGEAMEVIEEEGGEMEYEHEEGFEDEEEEEHAAEGEGGNDEME